MNEIPKTQGPFFEGLREAVGMAVPLAVEKYRLDMQKNIWEQKVAEAKATHEQNESIRKMNAASHLITTGLTTDNPALAQQGLQIISSEVGVPPVSLATSPAIAMKADKLRREQEFAEKLRGKGLSPQQALQERLNYFPEEALAIFTATESAKEKAQADADRAAYYRALAGQAGMGTKEYIGTDKGGNPLLLNKKTGKVEAVPIEGGIQPKPAAGKKKGSALDKLTKVLIPQGAQTGTYKGKRAYKLGDKYFDITTGEELQ